MNARINTVLAVFEMRKGPYSEFKLSSLSGAPFSAPPHSPILDLEQLITKCWNAELKRSKSLEPTHCTVHIPPVVLGDGEGALSILNAVLSVRANGTFHVLGSGSIKGVWTITLAVRRLLAQSMRQGAAFCSADNDTVEAMKKREKEEAALMNFVHRSAAPSLGRGAPVSHAVDENTNSDLTETSALCLSPSSSSSLVQSDADEAANHFFTTPKIVFARAVIHPVKNELRRIRAEQALQRVAEVDDLSPPTGDEKTDEPSKLVIDDASRVVREERKATAATTRHDGGTMTEKGRKRARATPEDYITASTGENLGPVNPSWRSRQSVSRFPDGTVRLNVAGDEAFQWLSAWVGATGKSAEEEKTIVLSGIRPNYALPSYALQHWHRVRAHVAECRARRLPRRAGVQFHLRWRCQPLPLSMEPTAGQPSTAPLLASPSSVEYFDVLGDSVMVATAGETPQAIRRGIATFSNTGAAEQSELKQGLQERFSFTGRNEDHDDRRLHEVDCILFSSGCGHVVCSSAVVMKAVIQTMILPILVMQSEL